MIRRAVCVVAVFGALTGCSSEEATGKFGLVVMTSSPVSYMVRAEANETACEITTIEGCEVNTCTSATNSAPTTSPKPGKVVVEGARVPITIVPGTPSFYAAGAGDLFEGTTSLRVRAEAGADTDPFDVSFPAPPTITPRVAGIVNGELEVDRGKELRVDWTERSDVRVAVELSEQGFEWTRTVTCEVKVDGGESKLSPAMLAGFRPTTSEGSRGDVTAALRVRTITEGTTNGVVVTRALREAAAIAKTIIVR